MMENKISEITKNIASSFKTNTIENLVKRLDKIEKDNTDIQDKLGKALAKEGW